MAVLSTEARGQAVLEYDQASGKATLKLSESDQPRVVSKGASLRLAWPTTIRVRVINGNTAVYRYEVESKVPSPPPDTGRVREFLKLLRPYFPEAVYAFAGPVVPGRPRGDPEYRSIIPDPPSDASDRLRDAWNAGRNTEKALAVVDEKIFGPGGLHQSTNTVYATLELMRSGDVERLSMALSDSLSLVNKGCTARDKSESLPLTRDMLSALQELIRHRRTLTTTVALAGAELYTFDAQRALRDSLARIGWMADRASDDYRDLIAATYALERFALPVARACASWNGRAYRVEEFDRRTLTLKIDPASDPDLARVATRGASTFSITLVAAPRVTYSLGASLLFAPDATYPLFGTRPATGGVQIFENNRRDARLNWGITFGVGWRVSQGLTDRGLRFWAPEITIPAASEVKSIGLGVALSLGNVKLGAGSLWVRHVGLLGQRDGAIIPSASELRTGDVYGSGKFYVSLSLFDMPPFNVLR